MSELQSYSDRRQTRDLCATATRKRLVASVMLSENHRSSAASRIAAARGPRPCTCAAAPPTPHPASALIHDDDVLLCVDVVDLAQRCLRRHPAEGRLATRDHGAKHWRIMR